MRNGEEGDRKVFSLNDLKWYIMSVSFVQMKNRSELSFQNHGVSVIFKDSVPGCNSVLSEKTATIKLTLQKFC